MLVYRESLRCFLFLSLRTKYLVADIYKKICCYCSDALPILKYLLNLGTTTFLFSASKIYISMFLMPLKNRSVELKCRQCRNNCVKKQNTVFFDWKVSIWSTKDSSRMQKTCWKNTRIFWKKKKACTYIHIKIIRVLSLHFIKYDLCFKQK